MAKYIMLVNWTEQGVRNVKESPKRLDAARALAKKHGCELKDFYMTMGAYDMVAHLEAPSDDAAAKFALGLAGGGNVRTNTLKAFSEADYRSIIGSL
jgi:uncharacterized protein with GYD domain